MHLATGRFSFWPGKKAENVNFISYVGIRGIYLSLTLGTAKFKQLLIIFLGKYAISL